ncbi:nucleotidyltransferase [Bacteroidia bacterium]|nr:nucleotidyltransferase [Bacteroidia bacterium]
MNVVEQNIKTVSKLCKQYKVKNMYLFGSILTEKFSLNSDIDFLVTFGQVNLPHYFDNYIGLKGELERIFHRPIDLVEEKTVRNPILHRSIEKNKKLIYNLPNLEKEVDKLIPRTTT